MSTKRFSYLILLILAFAVFGDVAYCDGNTRSEKVSRLVNQINDGSEQVPQSNVSRTYLGASRSPGVQIGNTIYDKQRNGSMGRMIVLGNGAGCQAVHCEWMELPCEGGLRNIKYNAYDFSTMSWKWGTGPGAGKSVSDANGGYSSIDAAYDGSAVIAFHSGSSGDEYSSKTAVDTECPEGTFDYGTGAPDPPNCQGWETGAYENSSQYIWPKCHYDECGTDTVIHLVATESPPSSASAGEIQTMVYYRCTIDEFGVTQYPTCATAIDSVYNITAVIGEDPTSDEVAIVWLHPIHYDGDQDDPCGYTQWQNDVYVLKSYDCGETWESTPTNASDYTLGGTKAINEVTELAYTDVSCLYDHNGVLHVAWSTPLRDLDNDPCAPMYSSKMWHWDDENQCISVIFDATKPRFLCDPGSWNNSTCKMNISECDGKLYCSFVRFGAYTSANGDTCADCSAGGYANGEIFVAGSSDGGINWGEAINLTNTNSNGCEPWECESEHYPSMAKYSSDSLHIQYIEDTDAGGYPCTEGETTCSPVRYLSYECFTPETWCEVSVSPTVIDYPTHIAPEGQSGCTSDETYTFDLFLANIGTESTTYSLSSGQDWLHLSTTTGDLNAGCEYADTIPVTIGPIPAEGIYDAELTVSACAGDQIYVLVRVYVFCEFYMPEYDILATTCWSVGVWSNARSGTGSWYDPEGNMYWFIDEVAMIYDGSLVIANVDDTCETWFSIYDGSDDRVGFVTLSWLTTTTFPTYEYAHGIWGTGDTNITGEIEYYLPIHPDTCVLIERVSVCNTEGIYQAINIGAAIDWDIPDGGDGANNQCGFDPDRQMLYQYGPPGTPEEVYHGGASFCHEIPGGKVIMNDIWINPNNGFEPCELGGLISRLSTFELAPADSIENLSVVYSVAQDLTLEPGQCTSFCVVKASSMSGLSELQRLMDAGEEWIVSHELDCPGCFPIDSCEGVMIGDANGSGAEDIDDVVYKLAYIFSGGPTPVPYPVASGDPNCDCQVDIDDVVYEIVYIFLIGPPPCECEEWVANCGSLH